MCDHETVYYLGSRTADDDPDVIEYFGIFWCSQCGSIIYNKADRHPDASTMPIEKGWKSPSGIGKEAKEAIEKKGLKPLLIKMAKDVEKALPNDVKIDRDREGSKRGTLIDELDSMLKIGLPASVAKKALIGKYIIVDELAEALKNGKEKAPCNCGEPYLKQGKIWWCPGCKENFVVDD